MKTVDVGRVSLIYKALHETGLLTTGSVRFEKNHYYLYTEKRRMYSFLYEFLSLLIVKEAVASALLFNFCKNTNIRKKGDR